MINAFEVVTNRRIIYGENKINEIAGILKWYGKKKVFFSTFSTEAEQFKRIAASLDEAGIGYVVYDKVVDRTGSSHDQRRKRPFPRGRL